MLNCWKCLFVFCVLCICRVLVVYWLSCFVSMNIVILLILKFMVVVMLVW